MLHDDVLSEKYSIAALVVKNAKASVCISCRPALEGKRSRSAFQVVYTLPYYMNYTLKSQRQLQGRFGQGRFGVTVQALLKK
jgi:hypothetical protein